MYRNRNASIFIRACLFTSCQHLNHIHKYKDTEMSRYNKAHSPLTVIIVLPSGTLLIHGMVL